MDLMHPQDPPPEAKLPPEKIISLEEIRRLMELGPKRPERSPSKQAVAEWAKRCVADMVNLVEAFAHVAMENPAGIFIQAQLTQIVAILDSLMLMLAEPQDDDHPLHGHIRNYLLEHFRNTMPKEF